MSIFPIPMPDVKDMEANLEKFTRDISAMVPPEMRGAANLMAHPLAASAAATMLGAGMASQMLGMWLGAFSASVDAAQKLSGAAFPQLTEKDDAPAYVAPAAVSTRAKAAVETMIADAEIVARETVEATVKMMKPAAMERPDAIDDLKAIAGIGPKLETVLNDLGIWTFGQIARLTQAEIAWLDERLGFSGRILRDRWLEQAGKLANETN